MRRVLAVALLAAALSTSACAAPPVQTAPRVRLLAESEAVLSLEPRGQVKATHRVTILNDGTTECSGVGVDVAWPEPLKERLRDGEWAGAKPLGPWERGEYRAEWVFDLEGSTPEQLRAWVAEARVTIRCSNHSNYRNTLHPTVSGP